MLRTGTGDWCGNIMIEYRIGFLVAWITGERNMHLRGVKSSTLSSLEPLGRCSRTGGPTAGSVRPPPVELVSLSLGKDLMLIIFVYNVPRDYSCARDCGGAGPKS